MKKTSTTFALRHKKSKLFLQWHSGGYFQFELVPFEYANKDKKFTDMNAIRRLMKERNWLDFPEHRTRLIFDSDSDKRVPFKLDDFEIVRVKTVTSITIEELS